jgi:peptidoglycan/LPS O-acetylase OafA/YrhL
LTNFSLYFDHERFFNISQKITKLMWKSSITMFLLLLSSIQYLKEKSSQELNSLFLGSGHILSSFPFAWTILGIDSGSCRKIGDFLSHKYWMPFGKLSYSIYMVHSVIQHALIFSNKQANKIGTSQLVSIDLV